MKRCVHFFEGTKERYSEMDLCYDQCHLDKEGRIDSKKLSQSR